MSDEINPTDAPVVIPAPVASPTLSEIEAVQERRDRRRFKYRLLYLLSVTGAVVLLGGSGAVIAIAYVHEKEINTDFITEVAKVLFDFAKYLYQG